MQSKARVVLQIVTDAQQAKKEAKQVGKKVAESAEKGTKKLSFGDKAKRQLQEIKKGVQVLGVGGDKLSKLGDFFTTGKLGVAVATVATVAMGIASIWDKMTLSIQQSINLFSSKLSDAQKKTQDQISQQQTDQKYMQRLKQLIKLQPLHNHQLKQATFLVDELIKRYGDLGISIDYVSGRILGLKNGFEKLNQEQKLILFDRLKEQQNSVKGLSNAQSRLTLREFSKNDAVTGTITDWVSDLTGLEISSVKQAMSKIQELPIKQQLEFFEKLRQYSKNDKQLESANKIIQIKKQQLQIQQKLQSLGANGTMSSLEYAERLKTMNQQGEAMISRRKIDSEHKKANEVRENIQADNQQYRYRSLNTDQAKSEFWQNKINKINEKISGKQTENNTLSSKKYLDDGDRKLDQLRLQRATKRLKEIQTKRENGETLTASEIYNEKGLKSEIKSLRTKTYKYDNQRYSDQATIATNQRQILQLTKQRGKYEQQINKIKQRQQKYYKDNLDSVQNQIQIQKLMLQGLFDQAEKQKLINDLKKQGIAIDNEAINKIVQKQKQLKNLQADKSLKDDALSLYDRLSPKNADTMYQQRMRKFRDQGIELNSDQQDTLRKLVQLEFSADNLPKLDLSQYQIKTNELTARGGFKSGVVMPESDRINMAIMNSGKSQVQILTQIKDLLSKMGWI